MSAAGLRGYVAAPAVHGDDLAAVAQQRDGPAHGDAGHSVLFGQFCSLGSRVSGASLPASMSAWMSAATWTVTGVAESCLIRAARSSNAMAIMLEAL